MAYDKVCTLPVSMDDEEDVETDVPEEEEEEEEEGGDVSEDVK